MLFNQDIKFKVLWMEKTLLGEFIILTPSITIFFQKKKKFDELGFFGQLP